jgi:chromate reductase
MTKLLAIAASYRPDSMNRQLLTIAAKLAEREGASVTMLDYAAHEAPLYRGEAVSGVLPEAVQKLSAAIRAHDGLLIASPEYNWSIPASLKNLIDWLSIDPEAPLNGKTALLMCATQSRRCGVSGLQQLRVPLDVLGVWTYPQLIGIGFAQDQLQGDHLSHETDQQHLTNCISDFIQATKRLL